MPTAKSAPQDVHLFVLAHADDEVAFAPLLKRLARQRKCIRLIYLTDGAAAGVSAATREKETSRALTWLGLDASDVCFAGTGAGIGDGELYSKLDAALAALERWSSSWVSVAEIYSLAWEGGHPDHDAALVVAAAFARTRGLSGHVWQVPFYRASDRWPPPFFTLATPLAANGEAVRLPLGRDESMLSRRLMRFYPSQWRSFAGLGPAILWRSLTGRTFELQRLEDRRLLERPTGRPLLYEYRNGVRFEDFLAASEPFLKAHQSSSEELPSNVTAERA